MQRPLDGVRVVEVASYVAVPAAGGLLADSPVPRLAKRWCA